MRCPETPGDPSHGLEVGEVEDPKWFSNQMATVEHMYRNTMGVVCTPTTPPRIPILLRSTVKDGGDDMHAAAVVPCRCAPFLNGGRNAESVRTALHPPGGACTLPPGKLNNGKTDMS